MSSSETSAPNPSRANITTQALMLLQPQLQLNHVQLQAFWKSLSEDIYNIQPKTENFLEHHEVPYYEVTGLVKEVLPQYTCTQDAEVALARAGEIFLMELALRAFQNKRDMNTSTLSKEDISAAILKTEHFDFLVDNAIDTEQT